MISLEQLRPCLEGVIPATVATCGADGIPNATYVSQMQYVDSLHVALSFQFFNKTRENVLANPQVTAQLIDPLTAESYRLSLLYLRTETEGAVFQPMKARLAGIASLTGMTGVFKLQGADVYRVQAIERVPGDALPRPVALNRLSALRQASAGPSNSVMSRRLKGRKSLTCSAARNTTALPMVSAVSRSASTSAAAPSDTRLQSVRFSGPATSGFFSDTVRQNS